MAKTPFRRRRAASAEIASASTTTTTTTSTTTMVGRALAPASQLPDVDGPSGAVDRLPEAPRSAFSRAAENGKGGLEPSSTVSSSSSSSSSTSTLTTSRPRSAAASTSSSASSASSISAAALLSQLQAALARREARTSSSSSSSSLSREEVEELWTEDKRLVAAAVAAVEAFLLDNAAVAAKASPAPASVTSPATPGLFQRRLRRLRPPSSEPTPPPPPPPPTLESEETREPEFFDADEGASAASAPAPAPSSSSTEESDGGALSLPVASWLKRHEPLVAEAAAASAEARTLDAEAAILALCEREGISAAELADECDAIASSSSSNSSNSSSTSSDSSTTGNGSTSSSPPRPPRRNPPPLGFDVAEALDRARELRAALANLEEDAGGDAPGFVTAADTDELRVRYRHAKGSNEHTVRFEATLAAPLEHVLALCSEIDLSPGWNRFVVEAAVVARGEEATFCSHYYAAQWSPRPFKEFDSAVRIRGHDAYDSAVAAGAVICLESWPPPAPKGEEKNMKRKLFVPALPPAAARRHRVRILPGSCIVLSPIRPCPLTGKPRTRGTLLVTIDPALPFVPAFLVAWVLRVLAPAIKRGIDAVMATWFTDADDDDEGGGGGATEKKATNNEMAAEMRRRLVARPELYELAKRLVERHAAERVGGLPASPERRRAAGLATARTSSGGGSVVGGFLRRRTSSASGPAIAAAVDGAIERLSRISAEVVERAAASAVSAAAASAAAAAERQRHLHDANDDDGQGRRGRRRRGGEQQQEEQEQEQEQEEQGWISWLTWPLSAATDYAWSFFYPSSADSAAES